MTETRDELPSIAAGWKGYEEQVVPKEAGPNQRSETQRAFYAGVHWAACELVAEGGFAVPKRLSDRLVNLLQEGIRFVQGMSAPREGALREGRKRVDEYVAEITERAWTNVFVGRTVTLRVRIGEFEPGARFLISYASPEDGLTLSNTIGDTILIQGVPMQMVRFVDEPGAKS